MYLCIIYISRKISTRCIASKKILVAMTMTMTSHLKIGHICNANTCRTQVLNMSLTKLFIFDSTTPIAKTE